MADIYPIILVFEARNALKLCTDPLSISLINIDYKISVNWLNCAMLVLTHPNQAGLIKIKVSCNNIRLHIIRIHLFRDKLDQIAIFYSWKTNLTNKCSIFDAELKMQEMTF